MYQHIQAIPVLKREREEGQDHYSILASALKNRLIDL
jgi:hypothetical protein